ncbi:MAG: ABC transporter permease [Thaumarchaeota archaeon]|nr:ABC transporter permease [Nitrososphaerota archaeon]
MKLYEYVIRRLLLMAVVLFLLSLLIFYLTRGLLPAGTSLAPYISPRMSDGVKLQLAQNIGVATSSCPSFTAFSDNQAGCIVPLWEQYSTWLHNVLAGNWGYTLLPGISGTEKTWDVFFGRFPLTAELAIAGAGLTILIGIPLGIISATHNNKLPDHLSRIVALGGYSVPQYWFGAILQILLVLYIRVNGLGLFPTSGSLATLCAICVANPGTVAQTTGAPLFDGILALNPAYTWDAVVALALPALTLAITSIGALTRIVRSSMVDVLKQDYILLARSKGLRERVVIYRHALRNALLPAVTIAGLIVAFLLGGAIVIEIVFTWPGVGSASLLAANALDINFLELYVLVTALIIVSTNLVVDILYAKLDPRIRY